MRKILNNVMKYEASSFQSLCDFQIPIATAHAIKKTIWFNRDPILIRKSISDFKIKIDPRFSF